MARKTVTKRDRNGLTADGLIPHSDLWYDGERVVRDVCAWLEWTPGQVTAELNRLAGGTHVRGSETTNPAVAMTRRWNEVASGRQRYMRLGQVDELCILLDLNLTAVLGDPDVHSTISPDCALTRGWEIGPPASYAELAVDPTMGRCDRHRRAQRQLEGVAA